MGLSILSDPGADTGGAGFPLDTGLLNAPPRIINRNPATNEQYSKSLANEGGPQVDLGAMEAGTQWSPYGTLVTHPYHVPMPYSLMDTRQATGFYNSAVGLWPANGQNDQPNAYFNRMILPNESSAHHGFSNPTGPFPTQVFFSPPVYAYQTKPIWATGL
jgi:hypothetical protein